jgi:hypothetical protein
MAWGSQAASSRPASSAIAIREKARNWKSGNPFMVVAVQSKKFSVNPDSFDPTAPVWRSVAIGNITP